MIKVRVCMSAWRRWGARCGAGVVLSCRSESHLQPHSSAVGPTHVFFFFWFGTLTFIAMYYTSHVTYSQQSVWWRVVKWLCYFTKDKICLYIQTLRYIWEKLYLGGSCNSLPPKWHHLGKETVQQLYFCHKCAEVTYFKVCRLHLKFNCL